MPLQNRVTPLGEIVAASWRGEVMGNRGCLHGPDMRLGRSRWRHQNWVCCLTEFRARRRLPMPPPGSPSVYTALFFWDEAASFAAGHRPCGECRRHDYNRFKALWRAAGLPGDGPREIDRHLHAHRVHRDRSQVRFTASPGDLPLGTFVLTDEGEPCVVASEGALKWTDEGYQPYRHLDDAVQVLTPEPIVAVFRAGYVPAIRSS